MAFDFPNAPTLGQVYQGYTWDGEKWTVSSFATQGAVRYDTAQALSPAQKIQARTNIQTGIINEGMPSLTDFNTVQATGFYFTNYPDSINAPLTPNRYWHLEVLAPSPTAYVVQRATLYTGNPVGETQTWVRRLVAGNWEPWVLLLTTGAQTLTAAQQAQVRANLGVVKKNYIINGAMTVSQENGVAAGTVSGYYPVDQFNINLTASTGAFSAVQSSNVASPRGSPNRLRITVTTGDATLGASEIVSIVQRIEGIRMADLLYGTGGAKTTTLQFGVKAPAGTYCIAFQNNGNNRSYVAEYVIAPGEANIDVVKSVTIPGDTAGTWQVDSSVGLRVFWSLMVGSSLQGAAGAWVGTGINGTANQVNFMVNAGNVFELFDVGLYEGTVAPPFVVPEHVTELMLCQRYWEKVGMTMCVMPGLYDNTSWYKVSKRAAPTITALSSTLGGAVQAVAQSPLDGLRQTTNPSGAIDTSFSINARL